jgi:hypothetical protein
MIFEIKCARGMKMKMHQMCLSLILVCGLLLSTQGFAATPMAGCYERIYNAADLRAHKGQIVLRVKLEVSAPGDTAIKEPSVAEALLTFWVGKGIFSTLGICRKSGTGILCNGADAATETDGCPNLADGVRDCRVGWQNAPGKYFIEPRPDGVLVTIPERLEVPGPNETDGVPFLYLSHGNKENHEFRLKAIAASRCK